MEQLPSAAAPAGPRRAAVIFIFITVVLDVLALGIIVPVLPNLIKEFQSGDTGRAATMVGLLGSLGALMQFFAAPVLGALSDRFGRRPIILISCLGLALDYVVIALAPNMTWLVVARIVAGITSASFSTASAYIADVTPVEKRAASFGMIGAAFGLGFVAGPALGGLLGNMDLRLPFWIAAGLTFANFLYGMFVLPESLPRERRTPRIIWKDANPIGALTMLAKYPGLLALMVVFLLYSIAHDVMPSTFVLYGGYRYNWSIADVGYTLAAIGIATAIVQGGLIRPIIKLLGERGTLMLGLSAGAVGFGIYGMAPVGAIFLLAVPVQAVWGVASPAMQSIMSRAVDPSEQGRLQGAITSMRGIAGVIGPFLFAGLFRAGIEANPQVPGAALYLAAGLLVLATVLAMRAADRASRLAASGT